MLQSGYILLILAVIVAALGGVLLFAVLRLSVAARQANRRLHREGAETTLLAGALQEALGKLREQGRATQARAEASERLSGEIIASLTSGLLVVGLGGEVWILNPSGERLLGLSGPPSGGSFRDLLSSRAGALAGVIDEGLAAGRPIVRRTVALRSPGSAGVGASHLGVSVSPMLDGSGALQGVICLFTDLSTVVDLEEQLRLKDSLSRLGELTAGLAHEFRNGLATIHGYSRLLDFEKLPDGYLPYVQGIRQETDSLRQVVDNFLNYARPVELTLTTIALRRVAERAVDDIRAEARSRGGDVRVDGEFADIEADEILLRQALSNLCRNALEACSEARVQPLIVLHGAVDRNQNAVHLSVTDNGPGIDPASHDLIFRPFFTTKADGTGLGLALAQKIIVTHNGRVTAGVADEGGARLEVVFPLSPTP